MSAVTDAVNHSVGAEIVGGVVGAGVLRALARGDVRRHKGSESSVWIYTGLGALVGVLIARGLSATPTSGGTP